MTDPPIQYQPDPLKMLSSPLKLSFFDIPVEIHTDTPEFFDNFIKIYHRFLAPEGISHNRKKEVFTLLISPENPWEMPVLLYDHTVVTLSDPWLFTEVFVYETLLAEILRRNRSYILIHAGSVSLNGRGIILAADSGHGKTTLVMELVRRGFDFLSDELAALARQEGLLHPFPRSLRIRPTSLPLLPGLNLSSNSPSWRDKLLVDPEVIRSGCIGSPCPPQSVIILKNPSSESIFPSNSPDREIIVMVARLEESLVSYINDHPDTLGCEVDEGQHFPTIRINSRRTALASEIEVYCRQHGILVLDVIRREPSPQVFTGPAQLTEVPLDRVLVELLRRFEPGHNSDLLIKDYQGQSTRMFFELASILKNAHAFYLTPGPLDKMADLIESLI